MEVVPERTNRVVVSIASAVADATVGKAGWTTFENKKARGNRESRQSRTSSGMYPTGHHRTHIVDRLGQARGGAFLLSFHAMR